MKKGIGFRVSGFALLPLLLSCGKSEVKSDVSTASDSAIMIVENTSQPMLPALPVDTTSIFGSYAGTFNARDVKAYSNGTWTNMITVFIDSMSADSLHGHSVVAGTSTPFAGRWWNTKVGKLRAEVREPGTSKYDGTFRFDLDSVKKTLEGNWIAYDTSLPVVERTYTLEKRSFTYDPKLALPGDFAQIPISEFTEANEEGEGGTAESTTEDVLKFNPSTTLLTAKDVENMKRGDLEVMRNAIYARHGYTFRNRNMRALFDNVEWYMPVSTDIRNDLTEIEKKNIELLKRYEEHAERYYDYFGR